MRKRIVEEHIPAPTGTSDEGWLLLEWLATVEVTSEQDGFPIESVFGDYGAAGWRASEAGEQTIRLVFDRPVVVNRIQLQFEDCEVERTQEFTISWCASIGKCKEIVRQQWNFSPAGSTLEIEDYAVDLRDVLTLKLAIKPDIARPDRIATLKLWRVGGPAS